MNDFFSVLDDFELEEFVSVADGGSDYVSTFSFDTASDTSGLPEEDLPNNDAQLNDVLSSVSEVPDDGGTYYVWRNGNPFSGANSDADLAKVYASFNTGKAISAGSSKYYLVDLNNVAGLSFASEAGVVIDAIEDITVEGSAGVSVDLKNGSVQGGSFLTGTGYVTITPPSDADGDAESMTLAIADFDDGTVDFTASNDNLKTVTTSGSDGTITVTGDQNFDVDDGNIQIKNVVDDSVITVTREDGVVTVNGLALEAEDDKNINVVSLGDADIFIPPAADAATDIKIAKGTYSYVSGGEAYFMVNDTTVEGFVLSETNDAITVNKGEEIQVFDVNDTDKVLATITGSGYTITKLGDDSYSANIQGTSLVSIPNEDGTTAKFDFTITKSTDADVTIVFDEDGNITSVDGFDDLTSAGDKVVVSGVPATDDTSGLPLVGGGYISVESGNFTITGGNVQTIAVAPGDTVYSVYDDVKLVTTTGSGTIVDGANNVTYTYGGGYFTADENDNITGYVFQAANDYVILPNEISNDFDVTYPGGTNNRLIDVPIPEVNDPVDGYYRLTMEATKGEFRISELSAGSRVAASPSRMRAAKLPSIKMASPAFTTLLERCLSMKKTTA